VQEATGTDWDTLALDPVALRQAVLDAATTTDVSQIGRAPEALAGQISTAKVAKADALAVKKAAVPASRDAPRTALP
jgi:hypothetical protein